MGLRVYGLQSGPYAYARTSKQEAKENSREDSYPRAQSWIHELPAMILVRPSMHIPSDVSLPIASASQQQHLVTTQRRKHVGGTTNRFHPSTQAPDAPPTYPQGRMHPDGHPKSPARQILIRKRIVVARQALATTFFLSNRPWITPSLLSDRPLLRFLKRCLVGIFIVHRAQRVVSDQLSCKSYFGFREAVILGKLWLFRAENWESFESWRCWMTCGCVCCVTSAGALLARGFGKSEFIVAV